jgi:hypothetical protein
MSNKTYIPGVCNIGPAEIRARRASGYFGLGITIIMMALFYMVPVEPALRLLIFLPAAMAAAGFLQARLHFCAQFGMRGLFNVGDDLQHHESVDQVEYRRKDQRKAVIIIAGSASIGLLIALIAYWLPFSS